MSEIKQRLGIERQQVKLMSLQSEAAALLNKSDGALGRIWEASWPQLHLDVYDMLDPIPFAVPLAASPSKQTSELRQKPELVLGVDFRNHTTGYRDTVKYGQLHMGVGVVRCQFDPDTRKLLNQTPLQEWFTPNDVEQVIRAVGIVAAKAEILPNLSDDLSYIKDPRFPTLFVT